MSCWHVSTKSQWCESLLHPRGSQRPRTCPSQNYSTRTSHLGGNTVLTTICSILWQRVDVVRIPGTTWRSRDYAESASSHLLPPTSSPSSRPRLHWVNTTGQWPWSIGRQWLTLRYPLHTSLYPSRNHQSKLLMEYISFWNLEYTSLLEWRLEILWYNITPHQRMYAQIETLHVFSIVYKVSWSYDNSLFPVSSTRHLLKTTFAQIHFL